MSFRLVAVLVGTVVLVAGCSAKDTSPSVGEKGNKVVVDGEGRPVTGPVECVTGPTGDVTITVGAQKPTGPTPPAKPEVMADLTMSDGPPRVSLLSINLPDITLSIGEYRRVEQPKLVIDGKTYRIAGKAAVGNEANPAGYQQFEVELTCP